MCFGTHSVYRPFAISRAARVRSPTRPLPHLMMASERTRTCRGEGVGSLSPATLWHTSRFEHSWQTRPWMMSLSTTTPVKPSCQKALSTTSIRVFFGYTRNREYGFFLRRFLFCERREASVAFYAVAERSGVNVEHENMRES